MSTTHPLPPGGDPSCLGLDILRAGATEATLIVHNPPDVQSSCEVLGICAVPEEYSDPATYGWIVADFLAWKTLFYGVGTRRSQTWLSSLDIAKFLEGGSYPEDMVNKVLGANKDHITALPTDPHECAEVLFESISERAQEADEKGACLLVMIFAPTTPEQDVILEFSGLIGRKAYLTTNKIRAVIQDSVNHDHLPVILMTPSPFTGGWLCNPSLFVGPGGDGDIAHLSQFIAKSCGAAFANRLIKAYTTRGSPFLSDLQKRTVKYDDLMPIRPSAAQVGSLHAFHRKIHEALEHRLCDLAGKHSFAFDSDNWQQTYAARKGFPLEKWEARWTRTGVSVDEEKDRFSFLGEAFGGSPASQLFHISYLACVETETCPGDWQRPAADTTRELFGYVRMSENPNEDTVKRVFDAMEYRSSCMTIAQILVKGLGLPIPDGVKCRFWVDDEKAFNDLVYKKLQRAFAEIHNLFDQVALLPGETRHDYKAVRFLRPARWLAACVAQRFADNEGSGEEIVEFVRHKIAPLMRLIRTTQDDLLRKDTAVKQLGVQWITSLGYEANTGPQSSSNDVPEKVHGVAAMPTQPENNHGATAKPVRADDTAMLTQLDHKRKRVDTNDSNVDLAGKPLPKKALQEHAVEPETAHSIVDAGAQEVPVAEEKQIAEKPFENAASGLEGKSGIEPDKNSGSEMAEIVNNDPDDQKPTKACEDVHEVGGLDNNPSSAAAGQASLASTIGFADLATTDLETLLTSNPLVLAQVMAKAIALLKLEEARAGAISGAGSATAGIGSVPRSSTEAAAERPLVDGVRPAPVNPTPPQTPLAMRETDTAVNVQLGNQKSRGGVGFGQGSQARIDPPHRPSAGSRLADENEFWKSVEKKWKK